jgi:hypothetical protein
MRQLILCSLIIGSVLVSACKKELSASGDPTTITLQFTDVVGPEKLVLNTAYDNLIPETFTVTAFKYYVSNIELISKNGSFQPIPGIYHLVDASDTSSMTFSFPTTADSLVALSFLIGVDSLHNVNGIQTGDLSPSKGMFWSSSTGYIMAKLEGTSPASGAAGNAFQYDIGGFTGADNVLKNVTLALPGTPVNLVPTMSDTLVISISANVNAWFKGAHILPINNNNSCTTPGPLAREYADNYASMFTVTNTQVK